MLDLILVSVNERVFCFLFVCLFLLGLGGGVEFE